MMPACTATRCALLFLHNAARRISSSALATKQEIERVRQPGLETFSKDFFQAGVPVIITDAIKDWPAASWTPDVLREQSGEVVVPVEISRWHERAGRWGDYRDLYAEAKDQWDCGKEDVFTPYQDMPLSFFIDNFVLNKWELPEVNTRWRAYLAQHQLFEKLPNLAASVIEPVYIKAGKGLHQRNVWLGPSQTTTPLHQDPYYNLFAQIFGRKYVRLYHPRDSTAMHPFQHSPLLRNTSKIDVESPDVAKAWPDFVRTPFWECELQPGELLFVPRKW